MELSYFVFLAAILAAALAEIVVMKKCREASVDVCAVTQVRIDPCADRKRCTLKKRSNITMTFDFTPNFVATKLKTKVYWDNGISDIPFAGMVSDDGCAFTQCPTQAGKSQTLTYTLHVDKMLPKGPYTIKWKVWDEVNDSQLCCFKTNIAIEK